MIYYGICAAILFIGYTLLKSLVTSYRRHQYAKKLGCQRPEIRRNKWPGGIEHLLHLWEADKNAVVPQETLKVYRKQSSDTWEQSLVGDRHVVTSNPKNVQAILATQFQDFEIPIHRRRIFFPMIGDGIFTENGKAWEHSRAMLRPQFTRAQIADLELEEAHVQQMFKHLKSDTSGWTTQIDLAHLFFRLTIDSATEFLFGQSVQSQLQPLPGQGSSDSGFEWDSLPKHFDNAAGGVGIRGRLAGLFWLYNTRSFSDSCKEVHRFADHFVQIALEKEKNGSEATGEKQRYVFLQELVKVTKDPIVLRRQLLNILIAGRDTTAGLLGWTCWNLARHPAVFHKLRAAVLDTFGTYENPKDITFAGLKACSYLQYTMNETLRLFPTVPINGRAATKDTTIPCGGGPDGQHPVFIRKGQEVHYSVHVMHRRNDLWGPDADKFDPDRWYGRRPGWEFLPFNGGPRICLGQQFALTEAGYVLTRLIQRFDRIENCDPPEEELHQYGVTTAPLRVTVKLHEAKRANQA